jgi:L-amino acid N-acyltransferase YncA
MMRVRNASEEDVEIITMIYNEAVLNTTAIWNSQPVDVLNRSKWMQDRQQAGFPVLVISHHDRVVGYASYGDWRPWDGYRYTVEHSVYVDKQARRLGAGRLLMEALIAHARQQGKHVMVAGIESTNQPSIALHQQLGFSVTGTISEVGTKFGQWLDLTFLQLRLDARHHP